MAPARAGFPPGVPCWVDVTAADPPAAADFYGRLFGWELEDEMPAAAAGCYYIARLDGHDVAAVGTQLPGAPPAAAWNTYVGVEDADASATLVVDAGGRVLVDPVDVAGAGRMAVCADPVGAVFDLWQPGTRKGAGLVNVPNAWNWSDLYTSDPAGAAAFYGTVFGWEASPVHIGAYEATMWRLPGYADFREHFEPGLRRRHAERHAPDGFSDAIGWLLPLGASETPTWSVSFCVDDTDRVARRAEALGGRVLVAPHDLSSVRLAVLADPQGAVFAVTDFAL
jgi:predicted enzyme related to lactoylglutathione lyase